MTKPVIVVVLDNLIILIVAQRVDITATMNKAMIEKFIEHTLRGKSRNEDVSTTN